ncbi:RloB domain-containing protein (plasmid) [Agrobacterium tumefaciens]|uniref:RloB domain-containing protein n=1 Tax=Agrobacterium tumefaciens TaxID=358 RepID=A0AAJ4NA12_AGRTU|nr:RloB domain-containing protein [Agrobacterium tumefaciens]
MPGLTSRKKRPLDRTVATLRDAKLIIIATEGSLTEKIYFESFRLTNVQVRVLPSEDGKSSPQHVLGNAQLYKGTYDLGDGDELWLVIDVDRWPAATMSEVAARAIAEKIGLAVSNPSFEMWLSLHLDVNLPAVVSNDGLVAHLRSQLGSYNKHRFNCDAILGGIDLAVERAIQLDTSPQHRWPQTPGSRCYKIIQSIRAGDRGLASA